MRLCLVDTREADAFDNSLGRLLCLGSKSAQIGLEQSYMSWRRLTINPTKRAEQTAEASYYHQPSLQSTIGVFSWIKSARRWSSWLDFTGGQFLDIFLLSREARLRCHFWHANSLGIVMNQFVLGVQSGDWRFVHQVGRRCI